jgi:hypothetical protein
MRLCTTAISASVLLGMGAAFALGFSATSGTADSQPTPQVHQNSPVAVPQSIGDLKASQHSAFVAKSRQQQYIPTQPPNDLCENAILVQCNTTVQGTTIGAGGVDITSCTFNDWIDVWYRLVGTGNVIEVNTCGPVFGYDTALAVFDACGGTEIACNDDSPCPASGLLSRVTFPSIAGQDYLIRVSGYNGQSGNFDLNIVCAGDPVPAQVLYYEDFTLSPPSVYAAAIAAQGWTSLFVSESAAFATALNSGVEFDLVVVAHQNFGGVQGWEQPLLNWIAANPGKTVIISDWRTGDPAGYIGALGFSYGPVNSTTVVPKDGLCFDGLATAQLSNPGWGIFSYVTFGGTAIANNSAGQPMIARNGNIFFNGFLSDTFASQALGIEYIVRELKKCEDVPSGDGACCVKGNCGFVSPEACAAFDGEHYPGMQCHEIDCKKCDGDINGDGEVNVLDLLILLENWGPCPQQEGNECDFPGVCGTHQLCGQGDPFNCLCWEINNHPTDGMCFQDFFCAGLDPCPTGTCPDGFACVTDSCCGPAFCAPIVKCDDAVSGLPHGQTGLTGGGRVIQ